ncbi:MAG TPA: VPA1262 family N-terminal domain-containing protein [Ignavibacteria bacterium]|nr:VPA1262 family N-terminal domain-containing protein [Ignavibacteria bacterium]HMR42030.1 VPA1262 family N-terminal domain-containing protein [Ignavibacteria bacterium]
MVQELDYGYLSKKGILGNYNSCKIETIYAYNTISKEILILFSRVLFKEKEVNDSEKTYKFEYKCKDSNSIEINFGIFIQIKDLDYASNLYNCLKSNKWIDFKDLSIDVESLEEIPARYIKANSEYVKQWNKNSYSEILGITSEYHNIDNGSYILEYANLKKINWDFLFKNNLMHHLEKIQLEISNYSKLKIQNYPDKIGNVIFQFPIKLLRLNRLQEDCKIEVIYDERFSAPDCILIFDVDNVEKVNSIQITNFPVDNVIVFKNNKVPVKVTLYDKSRNVIIGETDNCLYQKPYAGEGASVTIFQNNTRTIELNNISEKVNPVFSPAQVPTLSFRDWEGFRNHETSKEKERKEVIFKTYFFESNNRQQSHLSAIQDLRNLINRHGRFGVYLVDPFVDFMDILNTLYFCEWGNVPMKIIGGTNGVDKLKKQYKKTNIFYKITNYLNTKFKSLNIPMRNCLEEWKEDQKENLNKLSNNFRINLEFRIPYKINSHLLHDRFIIFPYSYEYKRARVWSIGTSLNSVGKNFHVITELNNGEIILDQFLDLWGRMDNNDECLVTKIVID